MSQLAGKRDFVMGVSCGTDQLKRLIENDFWVIFFGMFGRILVCCVDAMLPEYSYAYGGNHD